MPIDLTVRGGGGLSSISEVPRPGPVDRRQSSSNTLAGESFVSDQSENRHHERDRSRGFSVEYAAVAGMFDD